MIAAETSANDLDPFLQKCREAGLKMTQQRLEVYKELAGRNDHPSAEDLFHSLRERMPFISLDTVYRTLHTLETIDTIRRLDLFDGKARYDARSDPHHHCICSRCHRIVDFQWESFDTLRAPEEVDAWGMMSNRSVVLRGVCRECLLQGMEK